MIERMMHNALQHRLLVVILIGLILVLGTLAFKGLPIDAFPDVTNVQVEIVSTAPGLSPLEIEKFVTNPIEIAMRGLPDLELMRSVTKYGISVVTLVFHDPVEIYFARQLVFERLASIGEKLPEGVTTEMGPVATAMGEIYQYTLEGTPPDNPEERIRYFTELRMVQDGIVVPQLKSLPGISEVNSFGGYLKQFQVIVDPDKLLTFGLTVKQVFDAIGNNNQNVGGNILTQASEQYIVRGVGLIRSESDIGNIVLKSEGGTPVFVRHVAEVKTGHAVRQGSALKNGQGETVGGIVMMLKGQNSQEAVQRVQQKVRDINAGTALPMSLKIVPFYDRSEIIDRSISTVAKTLAEGALLVLVVLYVLLRSVRGALVVIFALPLSFLLTFMVMKYGGLNANLMSLGGLAISIGMIIDTTIIQVENVQRHLGHLTDGSRKLGTVLKAVIEVRKPSIFGELIIALTFIPIIALQGMEGKMFAPLAYTVAIALLASLVLSILVIPTLCALFLRHGPQKESVVVAGIKKCYTPLLHWSLGHKTLTVGAMGLLLLAALLMIPRLGTEFVPIMDEGAFDMDVQLLPGTSLEKATEIADAVEKRLKKFPELKTIVSRTGQTGLALEARGTDKTGFLGELMPRSTWTTTGTREELLEKFSQAVSDIPGLSFSFSQPIQCRIDELVAGTRAQVIVKLFGDDYEVLQQKIAEISRVIASIPGVADQVAEVVDGQPYIVIEVDRQQIARYGINVNDVLSVVEIAIGGKTATEVYEGRRSFDLVVRFPEAKRNSVEAMGNILVDSPTEVQVPLKQLAAISLTEGPVQISREDGQRRMGIEFNIRGRDMGSVVQEAREKIRQSVSLPSGYYLGWGGQFENQQQAMRRLAFILPLVVGLILLMLFITFNSFSLALLAIFNLPFALVGGVFSLMLSGLYLSVPASVGFIVLFGEAVLNGAVLISYISQLRREGKPLREALLAGGHARLRPILMTASITVFSLIPMLLATGPGSEVLRPLAVVVVGGLFTSTLATLMVLPTMYGWFDKKQPVF